MGLIALSEASNSEILLLACGTHAFVASSLVALRRPSSQGARLEDVVLDPLVG